MQFGYLLREIIEKIFKYSTPFGYAWYDIYFVAIPVHCYLKVFGCTRSIFYLCICFV